MPRATEVLVKRLVEDKFVGGHGWKLRDIKKVETKRGERFVHSREVPQWFWDLPREQRPAFVSLSSFQKPPTRSERRPRKTWYLSVWGETVDEVLTHLDELEKLSAAKK
jgi:hypothetical protein